MTTPHLQPITLVGNHVRLEPLRPGHAAGLFEAAQRETFRYIPAVFGSWDVPGFTVYVERLLANPEYHLLCVCLPDGTPVGHTSFMSVVPKHRGIEIGNTWISKACRGTKINPEMKRLMLAHAFETGIFPSGPAIRVMLKTDNRNEQSKAAILKLGAKFEGLIRNQYVMPDGFYRTSAQYSITDDEWLSVRARLDARLAEEE
ncbi:MAG: RimJ/RimL family protein N-acetyltransferase [Phycisphaerales bacterium]|jgi:RimJ/RimL family protein N-acetyltransferase